MENGKTPGCDGIPVEFYEIFWCKIQFILFYALKYALEMGVLHKLATRGIISLLPKKQKDLLFCKNWRPIRFYPNP